MGNGLELDMDSLKSEWNSRTN